MYCKCLDLIYALLILFLMAMHAKHVGGSIKSWYTVRLNSMGKVRDVATTLQTPTQTHCAHECIWHLQENCSAITYFPATSVCLMSAQADFDGSKENSASFIIRNLTTNKANVAVTTTTVTTTTTTNPVTDSSGCIVINRNSGTLSSPNYPEDYPNSCDMCWVIKIRDGTVKLKMIAFDIEDGVSCQYDVFEVHNVRTNHLLEKACGGNVSSVICAESNSLRILFRTDSSRTCPGWSLNWTRVGENCDKQ